MEALIISGGDFAELPEDLSFKEMYVIACDKGYEYAEKLGIVPDLILGDFDSSPAPDSDNVEKFPEHKDDTDTMLAVRRAISRGYKDIVIACAFGGRLDHTIANIQAGAFVAEHDGVAHLIGEKEEAWVFKDRKMTFPRKENRSFSVFSLTDTSKVSVIGVEYECRDLVILNTFPIGISNKWEREEATVIARKGTIVVMSSIITNEYETYNY